MDVDVNLLDTDVDWGIFQSVKVVDNYKVNLISELRHLVSVSETKGEVVYWSFDREEKLPVVSFKPFKTERIEEFGVGSYTTNKYVVPPKDLRDFSVRGYEVGDPVYFLSSESMVNAENPSAFLLPSELGKKGVDELGIDPLYQVSEFDISVDANF